MQFVEPTPQTSVKERPAEAVSIGGVWIDEEIPGFRTLSVQGRELLSYEVQSEALERADGDEYFYRHRPARTLTVTYQLLSESPQQFRDRFSQLSMLLDFEDQQIIFNDEPDRYFMGSRAAAGSVPAGQLNVVGTFSIFCQDPYKYSTVLKEFDAKDGTIEIENDGMPCPIEYEIVCQTENAFVSVSSEAGGIELGDPSELDKKQFTEDEFLITMDDLYKAPDDMTQDRLYPGTPFDEGAKKQFFGTDSPRVDWDNSRSPIDWLERYTKPNTNQPNIWHGGAKTVTLPPDKNGDKGVNSFSCYFYHWFQAQNPHQVGEQTISFLTEDDQVIVSINLRKDRPGSWAAFQSWWIFPTHQLTRKPFTAWTYSRGNPYGNGSHGHDMVEKRGADLTIYFWGQYFRYHCPELTNLKCYKVQFSFRGYGTEQYLTRNYIRAFSLRKLGVTGIEDVKNRYAPGDMIRIADGKVFINGMYRPAEENIASVFFNAPTGKSDVLVALSPWAGDYTAKAYIRERWL